MRAATSASVPDDTPTTCSGGTSSHAARAAKEYTKDEKVPAQFTDFRRVLERKDVNIIVQATPDHWHTIINIAAAAAKNGWAGLVINGVIRDVDEVGRIALGVQALGSCPIKTEKRGVGQRDIDLHIGGVVIAPGDYVYADNNGVIVSKRQLL